MNKRKTAEEVIEEFDKEFGSPDDESKMPSTWREVFHPKWLKYIFLGYLGGAFMKFVEILTGDWDSFFQLTVIILLIVLIIEFKITINFIDEKEDD